MLCWDAIWCEKRRFFAGLLNNTSVSGLLWTLCFSPHVAAIFEVKVAMSIWGRMLSGTIILMLGSRETLEGLRRYCRMQREIHSDALYDYMVDVPAYVSNTRWPSFEKTTNPHPR